MPNASLASTDMIFGLLANQKQKFCKRRIPHSVRQGAVRVRARSNWGYLCLIFLSVYLRRKIKPIFFFNSAAGKLPQARRCPQSGLRDNNRRRRL